MSMRITQRQVAISLIGLQVAGSVFVLISQIIQGQVLSVIALSGAATIISGLLWYTYYRGWEPARYIVVGLITLLTAVGLPEPYVTREASFSAVAPAVLALVLAGPWWVVGCGAIVMAFLLIRAGGTGVYADPITLIIYTVLVGGMVLSRLVVDTALQTAKDNAVRAEHAQQMAEKKAEEQEKTAAELRGQNEKQQQLLDLVTTLETPTVGLADGVLLAPLVGHLDSRRIQAFTRRLLQDVSDQRARLVIMDIAGVSTVDTAVARALIDTSRALRLLGCSVIISGI